MVRGLFLLFLFCSVVASAQTKWQSKFIKLTAAGKLQYVPDERGNTIPDFSRVGYYQQERSIPDIPVVKTVQSNNKDDRETIQSAIDAVAKFPVQKNGFRGAVLLKKGVYHIFGTIFIKASGIVLRGEGIETKLIAEGTTQHNLIEVLGKGEREEIAGTRHRVTDHYIPSGVYTVTLESTDGLHVGDPIILLRPGTQKWISDLKMDQIEVRDSTVKQWQPAQYDLQFERKITKIEGRKITMDNPVMMPMEDQYGGAFIYRFKFDGRMQDVAVEDLVCISAYASETDEAHGWSAVFLNRIENGWVRNISTYYFGYAAVNLGSLAKNITVQNCSSLQPKSQVTGGRRYSFNNDGQCNLVIYCFASEGRHDYVTGAWVCGPNVFTFCKAEKVNADIGPHHRWATGTLYDNIITDGEINAQDRGNWGTGHGWSGVTQVFWNCKASRCAIQNPYVSGKNYCIGLTGSSYDGRFKGRPLAEWEGMNQPGLTPASLFVEQSKQNKQSVFKSVKEPAL
ncbi:MAG: hypothetical protein QM725_14465 [Lacibacter sp.]